MLRFFAYTSSRLVRFSLISWCGVSFGPARHRHNIIYTKILARRMQARSERLLWEAQGGFRPGRGCMDQIFSLCMIMEKFLAVNQKVFCVFVDLEKVFDRAKLWDILLQYNVSGPLLQAVKSLYRDHPACVRVGAGMSPWLDIRSGVKQGCAMSAWFRRAAHDRRLPP